MFPQAALLLLFFSSLSYASQKDFPGASDHPIVTRYPGTHIVQYIASEFDRFFLPNAKSSYSANLKIQHPKQTLEGKITTIEYQADSMQPFLQVLRNFQSALEREGFKIGFRCDSTETCGPEFGSEFLLSGGIPRFEKLSFNPYNTDSQSGPRYGYVNGKLRKGSNDIYVSVLVAENRETPAPLNIILDVIEVKAMQDNLVTVDAKNLTQSIQDEGKAVLHGILFDTDKATIKPESAAALKVIADYLTKNKTAKVFVVGHTDTSGDYTHNLGLSGQRANAVAITLVASYGIDKNRLHAVGVGPVAPVSNNTTEEGKAKNRRVEMVLN